MIPIRNRSIADDEAEEWNLWIDYSYSLKSSKDRPWKVCERYRNRQSKLVLLARTQMKRFGKDYC